MLKGSPTPAEPTHCKQTKLNIPAVLYILKFTVSDVRVCHCRPPVSSLNRGQFFTSPTQYKKNQFIIVTSLYFSCTELQVTVYVSKGLADAC